MTVNRDGVSQFHAELFIRKSPRSFCNTRIWLSRPEKQHQESVLELTLLGLRSVKFRKKGLCNEPPAVRGPCCIAPPRKCFWGAGCSSLSAARYHDVLSTVRKCDRKAGGLCIRDNSKNGTAVTPVWLNIGPKLCFKRPHESQVRPPEGEPWPRVTMSKICLACCNKRPRTKDAWPSRHPVARNWNAEPWHSVELAFGSAT